VVFIVPGLKTACNRVDKSNWQLFTGLSIASLVLNGDGLPSVSCKCAVTVSAITGHADLTGTVTIGSEVLTFTSATRKTTTVLLSALPAITTSGLDCQLLIEALSSGGANIQKETLTAITCRFMNVQKSYRDALGNWTTSQAQALTADASSNVGGILRIGSTDYTIMQMESYSKLSGREFLRRLYLQ